MREILFRGQTRRKGEYTVNMAGDKCESNWVYGGIFPQNKDGDFAIIYQQEPEIRKFTVYDDTVGQYTGLTDKNGVKIFEGDIVKHYNAVYEISYITKYARFAGRNSGCIFAGIPLGNTEVIGNIYDNPELLEATAKPAAKNAAQSGLAPATENFELMEG